MNGASGLGAEQLVLGFKRSLGSLGKRKPWSGILLYGPQGTG